MVECIRDFCILTTFNSYDIYISDNAYDYENLSDQILQCINLIERTFADYNIDKNLNNTYISLNLIYGNKMVNLEFTKKSQEEITSQIFDALYK